MSSLEWMATVLAVWLLLDGRLPSFAWRRSRPSQDQLLQLARLLGLGLSAGLPLAAALRYAGEEVPEPLASEVTSLLRRARVQGLALALVEAGGTLVPLARRLARAQVTGAPLAAAVSAFARSRRAEARARHLERSRTLPIRLIVPISLLLLPGFLALVVGPLVVEQMHGLFAELTP